MKSNKLIIAAAGSGKTTFLVKSALERSGGNVLITTYTRANESEIRKKIIELNKCIPPHITVQTWFSFLLQHGVRPYQGALHTKDIKGLLFVEGASALKFRTRAGAPIYYKEDGEFEQHYFSPSQKIYSDKLSKFTVRANEKSEGKVIDRLSRIYSDIFIDEVQDMAGYDLECIKLLFGCSSNIILVGDPRQATYVTHNEHKYSQYARGGIKEFVLKECAKDTCAIDETSLNKSHRNNAPICTFSSKLYPHFTACAPNTDLPSSHDGIFLIREQDVDAYLEKYLPTQLRSDRRTTNIRQEYPVMNFGESKGLSFDRVMIYPTGTIKTYLRNGKLEKTKTVKGKSVTGPAFDIPKFYVAVTRARFSVGIVCDFSTEQYIDGIEKYDPNTHVIP